MTTTQTTTAPAHSLSEITDAIRMAANLLGQALSAWTDHPDSTIDDSISWPLEKAADAALKAALEASAMLALEEAE